MTEVDVSSKSPMSALAHNLAYNHVRELVSDLAEANPVISVFVATFNHRLYIDACLESILAQVTDYPFEVIISDDCSTDGTTEVLNQWQMRFPEKIKLLCSDRNLWAPAPGVVAVTVMAALGRCSGKYLVTLDGDDFLTSTNKLQCDVSFLESHPEYNLCFHNAFIDEGGEWRTKGVLCVRNEAEDRDFSFAELAANFVPPTSGLLMRNPMARVINKAWMASSKLRLIGFCLSSLGDGKARYFAEPMSVYRVTKSGQAASEMHPGKHLDDLVAHFGMLYGALSADFQFEKHVALMDGLKANIQRLVDSHCRYRLNDDLVEMSFKKLLAALGRKLRNKIG